jgi:hypothetical protein
MDHSPNYPLSPRDDFNVYNGEVWPSETFEKGFHSPSCTFYARSCRHEENVTLYMWNGRDSQMFGNWYCFWLLIASYLLTCCTVWVINGATYVVIDDVNTGESRGGRGYSCYSVVSAWEIRVLWRRWMNKPGIWAEVERRRWRWCCIEKMVLWLTGV